MVDKLESPSTKTGTNYSYRSASWQRKVSAGFAACRRSAYHNPSGCRVKGAAQAAVAEGVGHPLARTKSARPAPPVRQHCASST
jgi:hypothetical protein